MTKWKIYNEDAISWAKTYSKRKFHAILTDTPYNLESITKRFSKNGSAKAKYGKDGVFQRQSKGFMNQSWDTDIAFRTETWAAFGEVLYPGAFGMAFSASRNWHRMAVAIEDAGFIIHPTMFFLWVQGQGFPKATRIDTQIDKDINGSRSEKKRIKLAEHITERRKSMGVSKKQMASWFPYSHITYSWERTDSGGRWIGTSDYKTLVKKLDCDLSYLEEVIQAEREIIKHSTNQIGFAGLGQAGYKDEFDITKASTELAKVWEGHRYGLQALKPSVEPIIVFQKPYEGKPIDNIISTGAGTLNIDAARIPLATDDEYTINTFDDGAKPWGNGAGHKYTSRKVKEDKRLGGNGSWKTDKAAKNVYEGGYEGIDIESSPLGRWPANLILDEISAEKLDMQTGILISGDNAVRTKEGYFGEHGGLGQAGDVQVTYADKGGASRFFYQVSTQLDEADPFLYQGKVSPKERNAGLDEKNNHPTLKPINLAKYLATLLLPPIEYAPRRIFIPFSGSGSEMCGAGLAGWEHVVGVEFDTENNYVEIAKKRLEHWLP